MARPAAQKATKRKREDDDEPDDALEARLAAYGERFMSMFDDSDSGPPQPSALKPAGHSGRSESDAGTGEEASSDSDEDEGSGSEGEAEGQPTQHRNLVEEIFDKRSAKQQQSNGSAVKRINGTGRVPGELPGGQKTARKSASTAASRPAPAAQQQQRLEELARLRAERKRFMSSKAAVVTGSGASSAQQTGRRRKAVAAAAGPASGDEGGVSRAQFLEMQREVQLYGAAALDKKSKRSFEAEMLAKLGAKAESRPRTPASIGLGMSRKQAQRAQRALEEGIAAGMIQQKGLGKKKRREKAKQLDRGLNEDNGAFRPGMLRVKPPPTSGAGGRGGKRRK